MAGKPVPDLRSVVFAERGQGRGMEPQDVVAGPDPRTVDAPRTPDERAAGAGQGTNLPAVQAPPSPPAVPATSVGARRVPSNAQPKGLVQFRLPENLRDDLAWLAFHLRTNYQEMLEPLVTAYIKQKMAEATGQTDARRSAESDRDL